MSERLKIGAIDRHIITRLARRAGRGPLYLALCPPGQRLARLGLVEITPGSILPYARLTPAGGLVALAITAGDARSDIEQEN